MAENIEGTAVSSVSEGRIQKGRPARSALTRVRRGAGGRLSTATEPIESCGRQPRSVAQNLKAVVESGLKRGEGSKSSKVTTGPPQASTDAHLVLNHAEMVSHLRRLTEEHSKLQAEYARVRMLLQEACSKFSSGGPSSPIPAEGTEENHETKTTPDVTLDGITVTVAELEKATTTAVDDENFEASEPCKELFRREVLRLKEELLSTQQQLSISIEEKNRSVEDLVEMQNRRNELEQQLQSRDLLIEQLSAQVQHLNERLDEKTYKVNRMCEESKELQAVFLQRLREVEQEARETKEFMQEENNSLTETLREVEEKANCYSIECEKFQYALESKDKHCHVLSQVLEQTQTRLQLLQVELTDTQDGARELLLKQGSEINACSVAIHRLHQLTESISENILHDAELSGLDMCPTTGKSRQNRQSAEGRKLVHAILEAARHGDLTKEDTVKNTPENNYRVDGAEKQDRDIDRLGDCNNSMATQVKEVESDIIKLGHIQHTVYQYLLGSLNDAENFRLVLEEDLASERKRLELLQSELEDNCKRRWTLEEKNRELLKELDETKDKLRDAHESLKGMWDKVNERASGLMENKKLKQEVTSLKKQICMLNDQNALLVNELKEAMSKLDIATCNQTSPSEQRENCTDHIEKQLALKREILHLQQLLVAKEEDLNEEKQTHERRYKLSCENLRKAELEVLKLDASIEHILQVLNAAPDLKIHPVLQRLWLDLDGQSFTSELDNRGTNQDLEGFTEH